MFLATYLNHSYAEVFVYFVAIKMLLAGFLIRGYVDVFGHLSYLSFVDDLSYLV